MRFKKAGILCLFVALLSACNGTDKFSSASDAADVVDLRRDLADYKDMDFAGRDSILRSDSDVLAAFMDVVSGEPVSDGVVEGWSNSLQVTMFTPPADSVFPSADFISKSLGHVVAAAASEGLALHPYRYAAVVYGRPESILFVDSVMLIALNHYLGSDFEGYSHLPAYMRMLKNKEMLPYDLAESLVATSYPYIDDAGADVLSRMLYEGALTEAKLRTVPDADLAHALGYSEEQLQWLRDNEARLWRTLVGKDLLYDKSGDVMSRLFSMSPSSRDLDPVGPGRAGRYFGYRIVEKYISRHPEASLEYILSPSFTSDRKVLGESGYNPS